ncbi:hypothetical protein GGI24_004177 [Coemansia furcata]|nr:hypothetical protein GGI24_004177 [Coemansia furcata]
MVFSVYNDSDYSIMSRTAHGVFWQTVIPRTSTTYYLKDRMGQPDNFVLIASEYGLFYGEIAEGQSVRVKTGNRISYHSTGGVVDDYFAEQVFASDLQEYRVGRQELVEKVAEMQGCLSIEDD